MFYSSDPLRDAEREERKAKKWLESRPSCSVCGEPIQDESAVLIRDEWICDECLNGFRRFID